MGITINGPSGIDTASLIEQLVGLEQQRVTKVQTTKSGYQVKIDAYSKLKSFLSDISAKSMNLNNQSSFEVFKTSTSDESAITLKGGIGAAEGRYDIMAYHLAKNEKMISANGRITSNSATMASLSITTGDISIDGTTITILGTDTINDLRSKINNATDADGDKLGVTASVLKLSDTNYRLVLSAKDGGAAGVQYKDVTGSTLQNLGLITAAAGDKGNTAQTLSAAVDFNAIFTDPLTVGSVIGYSGLDHDGNKVSNSFVRTATSTVNDFIAQVKATYHEMADVSIDAATGKMTITDKVSGTSQLSVGSLTVDSTTVAITIDVVGHEGAGVLSTGSNSFFSVDGLFMNSSSNNPEGFISGVTMQFKKASVTTPVTVSLERDISGIQKKVQDLLDSYNALLTYTDAATKMGDPSDANSTNGELAADMTVTTIVNQVRAELKQQFGLFGGTHTTLTNIGVKSDSKTGQMSIDSDMFEKAISTKFDEVVRMFVTTGIGANNNVVFGRSTSYTQSGRYAIRESDANHMEIKLDGESTWYASDARSGDILMFSNGPAKGLSITAPSGALGGAESVFTFSKGLSARLKDLTDNLNSQGTGTITMRQDSLRTSMKDADSRIAYLQRSVDSYHDRLVKQFSAMEQALSKIKAQSASMMSALGVSS
jgi:flagellar hook-associated protein 2